MWMSPGRFRNAAGLLALAACLCLWASPLLLRAGLRPAEAAGIIDEAGVLDRHHEGYLGVLGESLRTSHDVELAVLIVETAEPISADGGAISLYDDWPLPGPKARELLVVLTLDEDRVSWRAGPDLQDDLSETALHRITKDEMLPLLLAGRHGDALVQGVQAARGHLEAPAETGSGDWLRFALLLSGTIVLLAVQMRRQTRDEKTSADNPYRRFGRLGKF